MSVGRIDKLKITTKNTDGPRIFTIYDNCTGQCPWWQAGALALQEMVMYMTSVPLYVGDLEMAEVYLVILF